MDQVNPPITDTQVSTPTAAPIAPPPPQSNKQLISILVGISAFALGVAGFMGYKYLQLSKSQQPTKVTQTTESTTSTPTPTADPTADWKTYTNKLYSFKYPTDINLKENAGNVSLSKWGPSQRPDTELNDGLSLSFRINTLSGKTLEASIDQTISESAGVMDVEKPREKTVFNGYTGYTYTLTGLGIQMSTAIQAPQSPTEYVVIINSTVDPTNQGFKQIAQQILSTFKFTNNTVKISTSLAEAKTACIKLQGSKAWDESYKECNEAGTTKSQLEALCSQYKGRFVESSDTCRHFDKSSGLPCGPEATYYCSFADTK